MKYLDDAGLQRVISNLPTKIRSELSTELAKLGTFSNQQAGGGEFHIKGLSYEIVILPHIVVEPNQSSYTYTFNQTLEDHPIKRVLLHSPSSYQSYEYVRIGTTACDNTSITIGLTPVDAYWPIEGVIFNFV